MASPLFVCPAPPTGIGSHAAISDINGIKRIFKRIGTLILFGHGITFSRAGKRVGEVAAMVAENIAKEAGVDPAMALRLVDWQE